MSGHRQPHSAQVSKSSERHGLGKPQLFVQFSFGISWSERRIPQTHTIGYTSQNLKKARDAGQFPRPDSSSSYQSRRRGSSQVRYRDDWSDHDCQRGRPSNNPHPRHGGPPSPTRSTRLDVYFPSHERGSSAPPPTQHNLWNDEEGGPAATLFPHPTRATTNPYYVDKELPPDPASFRLGESDLPWSLPAFPFDSVGDNEYDKDDDGASFHDSIVLPPLSPQTEGPKEDPQRAKDLESLSTAMVTVDNGFENQWWNRGQRESTAWLSLEDAEEDIIPPMSMADAILPSVIQPYMPSAIEPYSPGAEIARHDLVSPLSDDGSHYGGFHSRSNSIRSDELWMGGLIH
ncbi:hypothetical protein GGR50DRAFT_278312 [Xylaria sp. CBS 124048]|nr:hypothetical protein GGR50DRAFT_278312 [Xylaria sp. CBS 124048]